ncbi:hypothetical protein NITHO_2320004 [Nitrolancea hollandica Lb]|uniref:Uncharacterized protein n=1 Tax=Nitrolancea hollandica Lb TaxID=1129897 RepID=I4EFM6_9BACT|nr:hypothetical protein NITHO_2320004 [Nitrolancea hollandica Lb]
MMVTGERQRPLPFSFLDSPLGDPLIACPNQILMLSRHGIDPASESSRSAALILEREKGAADGLLGDGNPKCINSAWLPAGLSLVCGDDAGTSRTAGPGGACRNHPGGH